MKSQTYIQKTRTPLTTAEAKKQRTPSVAAKYEEGCESKVYPPHVVRGEQHTKHHYFAFLPSDTRRSTKIPLACSLGFQPHVCSLSYVPLYQINTRVSRRAPEILSFIANCQAQKNQYAIIGNVAHGTTRPFSPLSPLFNFCCARCFFFASCLNKGIRSTYPNVCSLCVLLQCHWRRE